MKTLYSVMAVLVMMFMASRVNAQISSNGTGGGKWSSTSTWQGGVVPTGSGTITILSTDSVYFDANVTITGTLKSSSGRWGSDTTKTISFGSGGVYEHAANGGSLIKATWNSGSTCLITGLTSAAPSNGNQNFYNLTWNCAGQSAGLNLGMANNTIAGNVRTINSNSQYFRLTAGNTTSPTGRKLITINGDIVIDTTTAYFTSTGSSSPNDTFSVVVKGNINSNGTFNLANGSAGMVNWFVGGNVTVSAGSFTTNSTATLPDSLIFNGTTKQTFVRGGAVSSSNIRFAVRKNAIVDFDTNTVGGSAASTFTLAAGGTLISGHPKGLKGNLNNGGGTILDTAANFMYDGSTAQVDTLLPASVKNLTINNASGFTLLKPVTINGVLTLQAGVLDNTIPFTLGTGATISYSGGSLKVPVLAVKRNGENTVPEQFVVQQNYPNPFNPSTTITYGIPKSGFVSVKIYNLVGQEIATLFSGNQNAGFYSLNFDASRLSSGVYLYRVQTGSIVDTKRMVLIK